jgi:hypothetical protein
MSFTISCPWCNAGLSVQPAHAGQQVDCPTCQRSMTVPVVAPQAAMPHFEFEDKSMLEPRRPEPWYYGFIEEYVKFVLVLGVGLFVVGLAFDFYVAAWAIANARSGQFSLPMVIFGILGGVLYQVLLFCGVVFFVALYLLLVDAARNLREMRRNTSALR